MRQEHVDEILRRARGAGLSTRPSPATACEFIDANRAEFGVAPLCAALNAAGIFVAASTYYARRRSPEQKARDAATFARYQKANRGILNAAQRAAYHADPHRLEKDAQRRIRARKAVDSLHSGQPWTPADDAIALDDRHSVIEAAQMLGRTPGAVKTRRSWLRR